VAGVDGAAVELPASQITDLGGDWASSPKARVEMALNEHTSGSTKQRM